MGIDAVMQGIKVSDYAEEHEGKAALDKSTPLIQVSHSVET
jgi:hypothetical protein